MPSDIGQDEEASPHGGLGGKENTKGESSRAGGHGVRAGGDVLSARSDASGGGSVGGGASLAKKLSHPLKEIRCRALTTLLQKLDLGFVSIVDLGAKLDLVKALLQVGSYVAILSK